MKKTFLLGLIFLSVCLLNVNVSAQLSRGDTTINATVRGAPSLNLYLQYTEIFVPEDYYFYENLTLFQSNSQNISVYLNKTDGNDFVKFINETPNGTYYQDDYTMPLPLNTYENVTLRVYVPSGMGYDGGTYNVPIYANSLSDNRTNSTTLKIHVNTTNPIDDIEILSIFPSSLYSGESLTVDISIHKIYPTETTDIQICYCTSSSPNYQCGPAYNNHGCSWKAITEWLNYTKIITVNENPGDYYFIVAVKYPGDENIKRANSPQFHVKTTVGPGGGPGGGPAGFLAPPQPKLAITVPNYIEASPGDRIEFEAEIENKGNLNAMNTTLDIYGIPEDWVSITPGMQDIDAGRSRNYSVLISLPIDAYEQVYSLSVVAKSGIVETTEIITLTVAMNLEKMAEFLLNEAISRKNEAEGIIEKAKGFGMDTPEPEVMLTVTNRMLDETRRLFETKDYVGAIEKAKQTIEEYKSVINSVKEIVEKSYFLLMSELTAELSRIEPLTEEVDIIDSIRDKLNKSASLQNEGRIIESYVTLLEAKQLLYQLRDKIFFMDVSRNIAVIAIIIIIIIIVLTLVFYKKGMTRFLKIMLIEDQKKRLRHLFGREIRPRIPYKERPTINRERLEEVSRLLEIGEALVDTDAKEAKEAYFKARDIYDSLSVEEKKLLGEEAIRLTRLYNNIVKKSREKKG